MKPRSKKEFPDVKTADPILDAKISRAQAARLLRLTRGRISQLEHEGIIHADADGKFVLEQLVHDWLKHIEQRTDASRMEDEAKVRKLKIEALEVARAEKIGELVQWSWVKNLVLLVFGWFISRLDGIPARFTRDLAERRRLQAMINEVRTEFIDQRDKLIGKAERVI